MNSGGLQKFLYRKQMLKPPTPPTRRSKTCRGVLKKCKRCRSHGVISMLKGHKFCPFLNCSCQICRTNRATINNMFQQCASRVEPIRQPVSNAVLVAPDFEDDCTIVFDGRGSSGQKGPDEPIGQPLITRSSSVQPEIDYPTFHLLIEHYALRDKPYGKLRKYEIEKQLAWLTDDVTKFMDDYLATNPGYIGPGIAQQIGSKSEEYIPFSKVELVKPAETATSSFHGSAPSSFTWTESSQCDPKCPRSSTVSTTTSSTTSTINQLVINFCKTFNFNLPIDVGPTSQSNSSEISTSIERVSTITSPEDISDKSIYSPPSRTSLTSTGSELPTLDLAPAYPLTKKQMAVLSQGHRISRPVAGSLEPSMLASMIRIANSSTTSQSLCQTKPWFK